MGWSDGICGAVPSSYVRGTHRYNFVFQVQLRLRRMVKSFSKASHGFGLLLSFYLDCF